MKLRFNSFDIVCAVTELQKLVGLRVNQIYDVDNKTYLIRLQGKQDTKKIILMESGIRFHSTSFEWPKNVVPSGFTMKLRKHLKNKRLEKLQQLGDDRIVDFQFGIGEVACHIILELYDRGNIILADHEMCILYILRPHQEGEDIRFAVREKYPSENALKDLPLPNEHDLISKIQAAKPGDSLKQIIMSMISCGPAVIHHVLKIHLLDNCIISFFGERSNFVGKEGDKIKQSKKRNRQPLNTKEFNIENDIKTLMVALQHISDIMEDGKRTVSKGYIIQKKEEKPSTEEGKQVEHLCQNIEYHPYNFCQYEGQPITQFETFMMAVDEFYSTLEGQKIDMKTLQKEREALKKLSNVKNDHVKRIEELNKVQEGDKRKADIITINQSLVDNAILAIRSAIANQMSWPDIRELVKAAQTNGDPVAGCVEQLKLEINHISLKLSDPYSAMKDTSIQERETVVVVDVDLALSAWANARKYYDQKRSAAQKEQKTIDASQKALKSAERKTEQTLKDVRTISVITKARKVYWFEKFYWFISSENYLVIGGRDAQQNELIVKRYMRRNDIYVHAEIQGASSVVVRNPTESDVPPKTLLEAGTMAISYSVAWDAKVVTNAYWVRSDQVSKNAPTGEYLGTGSFMIRGKKNFLPSCHLIMGVSLLFKLQESSIENHRGERKERSFEEKLLDTDTELKTISLESQIFEDTEDVEVDIQLGNDNSKGEEKNCCETANETVSEFPDTHVKVEHDTVRMLAGRISFNDGLKQSKYIEVGGQTLANVDQSVSTIIEAALPRKKQQQNAKKRKEEKQRKSQKTESILLEKQQSVDESDKNKNTSLVVKRGQKGKLKKIKAKYKDQDEEERNLRMNILKSAGNMSADMADQKSSVEFSATKNDKLNSVNEQKQINHGDLEDTDDVPAGADVEMIDSLTGQPFDHDELLFVIPVVAPYQALQNYKYKVKLTPGTGKRGRAVKTVLTLFSKDKMCTGREKALLKSIKEEALARNIPGKVKLSAPQLQKLKKF